MIHAPVYQSLGQEITEISNPRALLGEIVDVVIRSSDLKPILTIKLNDGQIHRNVEVINSGSSNGSAYTHYPLEVGGLVHVLMFSENAPVLAIGGALKPSHLVLEKGVSIAANDSDRKAFTTRDYIMLNDGNYINLTSLNGIVLDSKKSIRLQLNEEAVLRISRYGKCGDNILDGSQFIDILFSYIKVLEDKINAQSEWIKQASPILEQQFTLAAEEHTAQALIYTSNNFFTEAAEETQKAIEDTQSALYMKTNGPIVGSPLSITSSTAKTNSRKAINPYIQTPLKNN